MDVVVVGASLAGFKTAETLRRRGHVGRITLIGMEKVLPYDRPPLSKGLLKEPPESPTMLADDDTLRQLGIDIRLGVAAGGVDVANQQVELDDGSQVPYDQLVIATGVRPRQLSGAQELPSGVLTLRTLADAVTLRLELNAGTSVVIVGGGFIGAEVAAAARQRRLPVTIIEVLPSLMYRALGPCGARLLQDLHVDHGVEVICGRSVARIVGSPRVDEVLLSGGGTVPAALVVLALGTVPNTEWLELSGLPLHNGVSCDSALRVKGTSNVFAVGDVASWDHPRYGTGTRIEHWTNAHQHAEVVAQGILGSKAVADAIPYVWSDQYGHRIQLVGRPHTDDAAEVVHDAQGRVLAIYSKEDVVTAVLGIDHPKLVARGRRVIENGLSAATYKQSIG